MLLVQLALVLLATATRAQQPAPTAAAPASADELSCRVLTGRVTDQFAYPLTGATIMLRTPGKGFSPEAFSTNAEGHYIITSRQPISRNTVLEITAVGYSTLELPLADCKPLDITLVPMVDVRYKASRAKKVRTSGKVR